MQGEKDLSTVGQAHKNECRFYEMFRDLNDGFAPTCYYTDAGDAERPGLLIMDDLSKECATFGVFRTGTVPQFWNAARKIAHFQAVAACNDKDLSALQNDFFVTVYHDKVIDPLIWKLVDYDESKFFRKDSLTNLTVAEYREPVSRLRKVFSKRLSQYALFDKPREYGKPLWVCANEKARF